MNYYNNNMGNNVPMFPHMPGMQQVQNQRQIDPQRFKILAHNLNDNLLNQLAQRARLQGISEEDIQRGMDIIRQM